MSQTCTLEISPELFTAVTVAAQASGQTPAHWLDAQLRPLLAAAQPPDLPPPLHNTGAALQKAMLQLPPFEPPIGLYLMTADGAFIPARKQAVRLIRLAQTANVAQSLQELYDEASPTIPLTSPPEPLNPTEKIVEKEVLQFEIAPQDFAPLGATTTLAELAGADGVWHLCCVLDDTQEAYFRHVFEQLPIGIYQLDEHDRIVRVNQAWYKMLGFAPETDVRGLSASDFYTTPEDLAALREDIAAMGQVVNRTVGLRRKDGEILSISVSAFCLTFPDGRYAGRIGTMIDLTRELRYQQILDSAPVGLYVAQMRQGVDILTHCNQHFAELMELGTAEDVIKQRLPMRMLHNSEKEYKEFLQKLKEKSEQNESLQHDLRARTLRDKKVILEVSTRALNDREGHIVDRVGAVRDITQEKVLRTRVEELTRDIGAILHAYASMLLKVKSSTDAIIDSLAPDPFPKARYLYAEMAAQELVEPAKHVVSSLRKLLEIAAQSGDVLAPDKRAQLEQELRLLKDYPRKIPVGAYAPTLRRSLLKILGLQAELQRGTFAREPVRQLREDARELLRVCNLITLHQVNDVVVDMDYQLEANRRYVVSGAHNKQERERRKVGDLVSQAITRLAEFAQNRGVILRHDPEMLYGQVEVIESDLLRALGNLLHNAIKYSWERKKGESPWVLVRLARKERQAQIEIQNWGVPIHREEIERDLIFQLNYRGIKSSDRGRVGTGIGLHDARHIARDHGGDLVIQSCPALPDGLEEDYEQPFLTTAILQLPLSTH
jgi:PAS domain S-box-containing protein